MNFDGFGGEDARKVHYISANAQMLRVWGGTGLEVPAVAWGICFYKTLGM